MNKILLVAILLITTAASQDAYGQFWKKKKDPPKRKPPVVKPKETVKETPKKKREVTYPKTVIKDRYRVDFLLPLYLNDLVKNDKPVYKDRIPEKAQTGVNFYEGVKLAVDTLNKMGYEIDVHIHDITEVGHTPEALVKSNALAESDLIIGAVQSYQIKPVADYAKKKQINFISALSPADADILGNPYFTITQPTLVTHIKKLRASVLKKYPDSDIFLFYRTDPSVDSTAYKYAFEDEEKHFKRVQINLPPTQMHLQKIFDSTHVNVIMMPILDYSYAQNILEDLYKWFPSYSFEVYGVPSWKGMSKLRQTDAYPNVTILFSVPFHFEITNSFTSNFNTIYKNEFGGRPTEMTFRGYETTMWYAYLLKRYGNIFNEKIQDNLMTISKYDIQPQWTENNDLMYNENVHYFIYRYRGGSYMVD